MLWKLQYLMLLPNKITQNFSREKKLFPKCIYFDQRHGISMFPGNFHYHNPHNSTHIKQLNTMPVTQHSAAHATNTTQSNSPYSMHWCSERDWNFRSYNRVEGIYTFIQMSSVCFLKFGSNVLDAFNKRKLFWMMLSFGHFFIFSQTINDLLWSWTSSFSNFSLV